MATGNELINLGVCGVGSLKGYNQTKGCSIPFKDIVTMYVTEPDTQFDLTQEFNEDYIKSFQLASELNVLNRIETVTEEGTDPNIFTSPRGIEIETVPPIYKFKAIWLQDLWLNAQLESLEGNYHKRVIFVDSAGNILMTSGTDENKARGFLVSSIYKDRNIFQSPGVAPQQGLNIQLDNSKELDTTQYKIIAADNLDFDPSRVEPIVQAYIAFTAIPTNAGTTIEFDVFLDRGRKTKVTGLTTSGDFKVLINGTQEADSVATDTSGSYSMTTTALATDEVVKVSINGVKEVVGDALYVSNTASVTVV